MTNQEILASLQDLAEKDGKYREFIARVVKDETVDYLGVRVPDLRKLVREIAQGDWREFLINNTWRTHEEKMLTMMLPKYIRPKLVASELFSYFDEVLPHLSSWAQTDTLATKYTQIQASQTESYRVILDYIISDEPWTVRFGLILLQENFLNDEFIDGVLILVKNIETGEYYIKMAAAWLLATAAIKYRDKVEWALDNVDAEIAKFARQKMRDSRRVS
ncbi:DNA alkylation repair protein [Candidatus Saccharibacteria bacterium]|jgi:3-methyladenine DNA glycosylase AlkD|nr:DNA alkylation repair protein [Candidatus Saccharibacteria bacterium]